MVTELTRTPSGPSAESPAPRAATRRRAVMLAMAFLALMAAAAIGWAIGQSGESSDTAEITAAAEADAAEIRSEAEAELEAARADADQIRRDAEVAAPVDTTTSAAILDTVDEWMEAVRAEDPFRIDALYAVDAVWHDEALDETFRGGFDGWNIFGMIDGVEVELEALEGNTAVVRWTFIMGADEQLVGLSVLTFEGADIVAETVYYDCAQSPVASRCANMR